MKSDTFALAITAAGWLFFCTTITLVITKGAIAPDGLVVLCTLLLSPALFNPLSRYMLLFRKNRFVLMKKQHRTWLHLNPWLATGQPGLRDINCYWHALLQAINSGTDIPGCTLVLSSHLLSDRRTTRLLRRFPVGQYRIRVLNRPVSRLERTGLQIETLLREWRWFYPAMYCGVLVIRKKRRS